MKYSPRFWAIKKLNTFKRIEIIQSLLLDHNGIKLEIDNIKMTRKFPNFVEIKQHTFK